MTGARSGMLRLLVFRALIVVLLLLLVVPSISAIYCDEDDCYDLLGVTQASTPSDVKKAYYKLSLKLHPDKNPDPEAKKQFIKVANAYEILSDEAKREQYDYAIAHPEEVFYNAARYYQAYYGPQADLRAVLGGLLVILSGFQYLNQWTRYNQMLSMVKQTPAYKNKLKALELERNGSPSIRKKGTRSKCNDLYATSISLAGVANIDWQQAGLSAHSATQGGQVHVDDIKKTSRSESSTDIDSDPIPSFEPHSSRIQGQSDAHLGDGMEELSQELELQIQGAEKPTIWRLLGIRFLLLPYTAGKLVVWQANWVWRYWIMQKPYAWDDAAYLTQYHLGLPVGVWSSSSLEGQAELIKKKLWVHSNLDHYVSERRKEVRRRRGSSTVY